MSTSPLKRARVRARIVISSGLLAAVATGIWALAPLESRDVWTVPVVAFVPQDPPQPDVDEQYRDLPERIMGVALSDVLFPPPPEEVPEPAPPELGATLIAVVRRGDEFVAYIRDDASGHTASLRAGERLDNGAVISSVGPQRVSLALRGFVFDLELDQ